MVNKFKMGSKRRVYGNCKMLSPKGQLMARCDEQRTQWYLERNLAVIVPDPECLTIQFLFEPAGYTNVDDPYFLEDRHNHCVVCGSDEDLTLHHCVPSCFRAHFPNELVRHNSYDILALCFPCHHSYERHAYELKIQIADEMGLDFQKSMDDKEKVNVRGLAHSLWKYGDKIPEAKREQMLAVIRAFLGRGEVTRHDLDLLRKMKTRLKNEKTASQEIVEKLVDLDAFIRRWRQHFLDTMKPRFLSPHWTVDHK